MESQFEPRGSSDPIRTPLWHRPNWPGRGIPGHSEGRGRLLARRGWLTRSGSRPAYPNDQRPFHARLEVRLHGQGSDFPGGRDRRRDDLRDPPWRCKKEPQKQYSLNGRRVNRGSHTSGSFSERQGKGRGAAAGQRNRANHGQRTRDSRLDQHLPPGKPIGLRRLCALQHEDPMNVLNITVRKNSGFSALLKQRDLKEDYTVAALAVLRRACECRISPQTLKILLLRVSNSVFFNEVLQNYIIELSLHSWPHTCIQDTLVIFKALLNRLPNTYAKIIPIVTTMNYRIKDLQRRGVKVSEVILTSLQDLTHIGEHLIQTKSNEVKLLRDDGEEGCIQDFHDIPILPTLDDIQLDGRPFLRPNKEQGKFQSLQQYLDIQFRLLREDFIGPLRDGIQEYLTYKYSGEQGMKLQDLRLYNNVQFVSLVCCDRGLAYKIFFDSTPFKRVRWQSSKRLIYGSLVCLSKDDFDTMIFATVTNRDPEKLANGEVDVFVEAFENESTTVIDKNSVYTMAETSAFYESYRHVLKALKEIDEEYFPFQKYIVSCENQIDPPMYMVVQGKEAPKYDLTPLVAGLPVRNFRNTEPTYLGSDANFCDTPDGSYSSSTNDTWSHDGSMYDERHLTASRVDILDDAQWPQASYLLLDDSQYRALQTALTNEFAIIQGPPGTGKTYLGLKIVQVLLHNKRIWHEETLNPDEIQNPILVVCYTNHALDQFLDGILEFHRWNILRVGNRCEKETLKQFSMKEVKSRYRAGRNLPGYIKGVVQEALQERNDAFAEVGTNIAHITATEKGILREEILKRYMTQKQFRSLKSLKIQQENTSRYYHNTMSTMKLWLGLEHVVKKNKEGNKEQERGKYQDGVTVKPSVAVSNEFSKKDTEQFINFQEEASLMEFQRMLDDEPDTVTSSKAKQNELQRQRKLVEELVMYENRTDKESPYQIVKYDRYQKKVNQIVNGQDTSFMTADEARKVTDVWKLKEKDRWRLYQYWRSLHLKALTEQKKVSEQKYKDATERLTEARHQEDLFIMQRCTVIGMTTTGAARYHDILEAVGSKIVIVEEAAEVLEAHIITSLTKACQHLILIGDHKQLKPNPTVYDLAKTYKLDVSLFERMVNNGMPCKCLVWQHRMRPQISTLIKTIYPNLEDHDVVKTYKDIKGVSTNMYFLDHTEAETTNDELKSHLNEHEASYMSALCRYLLQQGYRRDQITILTMYTGQLFCIRNKMPKKEFEGVRISAVDNFQGEENDIILLSLVRSNTRGKVGFLKIANRICVALSRAKIGFYVIGNFTLLAKASDWWKTLIQMLRQTGNIGPHISLWCQNHPNGSKVDAATSQDFRKTPDGGCMLKCDTRLSCGHPCTRYCHAFDRNHTEFLCKKPCTRVRCKLEHKCPKLCYEECGVCTVLMRRKLSLCEHEATMECHQDPMLYQCQAPCEKVNSCGHKCSLQCFQACGRCTIIVEKIIPGCNHKAQLECWIDPQVHICMLPCENELYCGHVCPGRCYEDCKKFECKEAVVRRLPNCNHSASMLCCKDPEEYICREPCGRTMPACSHICPGQCHEECSKFQCSVEVEKVLEKCGHIGKMLCYVDPDEYKCNVSCKKMLPICGHSATMSCHKDPINYKCKVSCEKIFPNCGHKGVMPCYEDPMERKCKVPVEKTLPKCGHQAKMSCHVSPEKEKCVQPCEKMNPCGHKCLKLCHEVCGKCKELVEKEIPTCGHTQKMPCFQNPATYKCKGPCRRKLPCGHICPNKCSEQCDVKCLVMTEKSLPRCDHKVKVPCHAKPTRSKCEETCDKTCASCGHVCKKPCFKPCGKCNKRVVKTIPTCGHKKRLPCRKDPSTIDCTEPCEKKLPCGHWCRKFCYMKCGECEVKVTKTVPRCGHKQKMPCSQDPGAFHCERPCQRTPVCRQKCTHTCGRPCTDAS